MALLDGGVSSYGLYPGEGRDQGTLFPVVLDNFIPAVHVCRVIDAFVAKLAMSELGFERAQAAETGRPGYDPRDLLKLYLYGYLNQLRSSRRLETECRRNVELIWLLGRLYPDHKSVAEFRRMHRDAVIAAGAELMRFARSLVSSAASGSPLMAQSFALWRVSIALASESLYSGIFKASKKQTKNSWQISTRLR